MEVCDPSTMCIDLAKTIGMRYMSDFFDIVMGKWGFPTNYKLSDQ